MKIDFNYRFKFIVASVAILFASVATSEIRAQVSLTATAGTPTGSFTTLNAAFAAINAGTHQGAIVISITGNTIETAPPTPLLKSGGTSSYTTISIRPSGGNWTVNGAAAPTASRAMIELNGADNVTIDGDDPSTSGSRNLTFMQPTVSTTGVGVIRFASSATTDGASFNTLRNCNIIGSRISSGSSTTNYGIYSGTAGTATMSTSGQSDNNDNLTIENDSVARCYWGIYCAGTATNYMDNLIVRNNVIGSSVGGNEVANRGIYIQNTQALTVPGASVAIVEGNDIQMTASTGGAGTNMGIEVANGNAGALIRGNNIHDIRNPGLAAGAYGIGVTGSTQNASVTLYNNFVRDVHNNTSFGVSLGNSGAAYGIVLTVGASNLRVYYNSVSLNTDNIPNGTSTEVTCAFATIGTATGATNLDIRNNVFSNTQSTPQAGDKRYAIYIAGTVATIGTINNNIYYSAGIGSGSFILGNFNGTDKILLSDWQAATGQDGASGFVNPGFTSTTNLHIPAAASQLESGGVAIAGINTDFDGQARPGPAGSVNGGGTLPDIGADEFDGIPTDLTLPTITYTTLGPTCVTTDRTLSATITDASGVPVSGALQPRIYYKKNAGSYFSSQGVLSSGTSNNGTWTFTIVSADMGGVTTGDQVFYYVIAQDVAGTPNVVSNPAGVTASNVNSVSSPPASPNNYFVQGPLGGIFNVGVSQTYTTLSAAVNAYNGSCLTGPVTFVLTDASYPSEIFPITITSNPSASATNTLTIKPNTGVATTISGTSSAAIIKINGADYVTIDGLNSGGSSLTLMNNDVSTTSAVVWVGSAGSSNGATNNVIQNCSLIGNANTTTFAGVFAGSGTTVGSGGTAESPNNQLTVQGCTITKSKYGIYANGNSVTSDVNWNFSGNQIGSTLASDKLSASGIILFNAQNFAVNNNIITGVVSSSTTTASGIGVFSNSSVGTISKNKISDIKNTSTGAAQGSNGMQLSTSLSSANISVNNNFIWDVASFGSSGTSATANGWGMLLSGGSGYNIYFNTVHMNTDQSFASSVTAAINITSGVNTSGAINLRNNIFANTQTVGTNRYSILCAASFGSSAFTAINYNDYYFTGPNLGRINSSDQPDLTAWQSSTGGDLNSQSVNPSFVSATNLHLITSSSPLDNSGVSIAGITTDIDGDARPATPDMGADEFTFANNNCTGTPTAGTIQSSFTLCPGASTTLNVTGYTQGVLGITFQWEESDDNGVSDPWSNAVGGSGATTIAYVTPGSLNAIYYRCKVTCSFSGLFAYTNVCSISITPFTLPENFSAATFPAACWTNNNPTYVFRSGVSAFGVGSGSAEYNFYSATYEANLDLTTPVFPVQPAGYVLVFDHAYATSNAISVDELQILYSTNGGGSYSNLITYLGGTGGPLNTGGQTGPTTQFVPTAGQWASKIVTLPAGTNRLMFRGIGRFGNNLYIDNINILPPSACDAPAASASNVTATTADISWTCVGCTGTFDLDYGSAAHVAGSGTIITGVNSTYTLNPPLSPNTSYAVYVRQNCGVYGFSSWSPAVNFTTACISPLPIASTSNPPCDGGDFTLTAVNTAAGQASGNTYSWTGPGGFTMNHQDTTFENASSAINGTYTVVITNQYGCTASTSIVITVNPNPTVSASSNAPFCSATQNLNLFSNAPTSTLFAWTGPGGYTSSAANPIIITAPNTASGTYKVIATDANGCRDSSTTSVLIYALPNVGITIIGNANLCSGQTTSDLQATGAGATGTYLWNTSETTDIITVNTQGTYIVTGTDNHNCQNTDQVVITETTAPPAPIVTPAGPVSLCSFDGGATYNSITLTCTNYTTDLLWSTSETTPSIVVDYADNFNVIYTDASGCFAVSNTVNVSTNLASDAPTSASSDASFNAICLGNTVTLSVNGGALGDGADWHWYEGSCNGTPRGIGSSITLTPSTAGTHTYYVRAEGVCNTTTCVSISILVSTAPPQYGASITTGPAAGCNGTSAVMSGPTVNGASYYNWSCSQGGVLFNGVPGPLQTATPSVTVTFVSPPPAGASGYSICVFAGNACGQSLSFCRFVRARVTQPSAITGNIIGCANTNSTYSVGAVTGADTYTWTITGNAGINGGGNTITTASPSVTVNFLPGWTTGTLSVYASLTCGFNSAARTLAISSTPGVPGIMSGPGYVCAGSSASFSVPAVNGAASYNWTTTVPGAVVTPTMNSVSILFPAVIPAGSTVCVTAVSSCGNASAARCKSIANGIPNVPGNISGPVSGQCGQSGVSYSITPVSQATSYFWTATNGATVVGPNNLSAVSVNFPSTFVTCTLSVIATNSCGSSSARTLVVSGVPAQPGTISGNQSVCNGSVEPYSTGGSTGATSYNWVVPAGATILNTPPYTANILVMWGSTGGNVTVTAGNDCGTSAVRTLPVAVTCRESQINNASGNLSPELYPNPANDHATLKFSTDENSNYNLNIYDAIGEKIVSREITSTKGLNVIELDLSGYSKGIYFIQLRNGDNNYQLQLSVQ